MESGKCILLIDDHDIFRHGLRTLLADSCPDVVIIDAASVEQAMVSTHLKPNLVLLDIGLPGVSGLAGIAPLKVHWPQATFAVLSSLAGPEVESEALARGAAAFICKGEASAHILQQLQCLLAGTITAVAEARPSRAPLTARQFDVLRLLCNGCSNKLIARELTLSENTVRRHVQDILKHFDVASRAEAAYAARRRGLVE